MMKKLFSFILGFVATSFMASAQTCPDFQQPVNTGANMTVGINVAKFDQFAGSLIGAFYDLDGDGTLEDVLVLRQFKKDFLVLLFGVTTHQLLVVMVYVVQAMSLFSLFASMVNA